MSRTAFLIASTIIATVLLAGLVQAGVLSTSSGSTTAQGTLFTATWSQGCVSSGFLGSLGLNRCHSQQPYFCPLNSVGGNNFVERADLCDCPIHFQSSGFACQACDNPCDSCPDGYSCTPPATDWCTTAPNCIAPPPSDPPCPVSCKPFCSSGETSHPDYYCSSGRCCLSSSDPPPGGGGGECSTDSDCPDRTDTVCDGDTVVTMLTTRGCDSGTCYEDTPYAISQTDCSASSCSGFPMICVESGGSASCSCI